MQPSKNMWTCHKSKNQLIFKKINQQNTQANNQKAETQCKLSY